MELANSWKESAPHPLALMIVDPQHDFPDGERWRRLADDATRSRTVTNIEALLESAKASATPVFVSADCKPASDLLEVRQQGIRWILLGGLVAQPCVLNHLRALLDQGFQVSVVRDATVGARPSAVDYESTLANFLLLAHGVVTTADAVRAMLRARPLPGVGDASGVVEFHSTANCGC